MSRIGGGKRLWFLLGLALITMVVAPGLGGTETSLGSLWQEGQRLPRLILLEFRLPRTLAAFFTGAALSVVGVAFQAYFRNVLATPYTLGIAGGGAFGAALYVFLGLSFSFLGFSGATWFALAGCALSLFIVYGLTMARVGYSSAAMLLCGVAAGFFFSSLIMMIQYLSDFSQSYRIIRWLMGGVNVVGFQEVVPLVLTTLLGSLILFWWAPSLNLLLCGPEQAHSRGLNVNHARNVLFVVTSIMVGVVVSLCGPIGFVGLIMPHICRMLLGVDHRLLLPGSFLLGGVFLTWCDVLARTLIAPAEIPVGILTALCGGPFFFWLLTRPKTGLAL